MSAKSNCDYLGHFLGVDYLGLFVHLRLVARILWLASEMALAGHSALFHVSFTYLQHSSHSLIVVAGIQEEASPVIQQGERGHMYTLFKLLLVLCLLIKSSWRKQVIWMSPESKWEFTKSYSIRIQVKLKQYIKKNPEGNCEL